MPRVKRGTVKASKRRNLLKKAKGFMWGRKTKVKLAKPAIKKAGVNAYRDRRNKKRTRKALWNVKINALSRKSDISYSKLMGQLRKSGSQLDRRTLAELAEKHAAIFEKIVALIK